MPELRQPRMPGAEPAAWRTTGSRISDGLPARYYDPAARHAEPPAVTAARERHRAVDAEIRRRAAIWDTAGPGDDDIGYEWRREYLEDLDG